MKIPICIIWSAFFYFLLFFDSIKIMVCRLLNFLLQKAAKKLCHGKLQNWKGLSLWLLLTKNCRRNQHQVHLARENTLRSYFLIVLGRNSPSLKLYYLRLLLWLFQWKTLLVEKTVIVELGESQPIFKVNPVTFNWILIGNGLDKGNQT